MPLWVFSKLGADRSLYSLGCVTWTPAPGPAKACAALPDISYEARKRLCDGGRAETLARKAAAGPAVSSREKLLYQPSELARVVS
jgi:hypothetical protein